MGGGGEGWGAVGDGVQMVSVVADDDGCTVVSLEAYTGSPTGELASGPAAIGIDERLSLRTAIDELAERERFAVLGSFAAGLSQAQLGAQLGISQSQVSKVIKKALDKLHAQVA